MTERLEMIRDRLDRYVMDDLHAAIATPAPEAYRALPIPVKYKVAGWMPPLPYTRPGDGAELVMFTVCAEVIDEHTEFLDDEQLAAYLGAIELFMGVHLAHYPDPTDEDDPGIQDPAERERIAEDTLYEANDEALKLYTEVQMRALDKET